MRDIFMETLQGKETSRPPVWYMRQAGRVLPNYNALRQTHSFHQIMQSPDMAARVTEMPLTDVGVDAAILFNDILTIPVAMGMELEWQPTGPKFATPLSGEADPASHLKPDANKLTHAYEAISAFRQKSGEPLIGFCGAPLTTMCYMLQGISTKHDFPAAKKFMMCNKQATQKLIDAVTELSIEYARGQMARGIDAFQLFDTHAGLLPQDVYEQMFLPAVRRIGQAVRDAGVPFIYFPKGIGVGLSLMTPDVCDFVSIDWQTPLSAARQMLEPEVGLQGNLDPTLLFASADVVEQTMERVYKPFFHQNPKWIFNLGHGVMADTPVENLINLTNWIKNSDNWK